MAKAHKHREPFKPVKPKKKCCKSRPRCKRCPVVLKRLSQTGFAERREDGNYVMLDLVPKKTFKEARR
ncbi:hypothetical protein [Conexibacter sp. CPCC 206217]|uniref:hypothetical protein n=1 Tax=Conexibacter sp. CPCC 206217 TaxID=3064574 RepID=UPI00271F8A7C|nr:hypothetical protein [Conexibacter sp. CPCC 206217]MDO8210526.1 hypothetical protein [Conexibacter sp. CPCC 206217]